jgi:hypothetical protein
MQAFMTDTRVLSTLYEVMFDSKFAKTKNSTELNITSGAPEINFK